MSRTGIDQSWVDIVPPEAPPAGASGSALLIAAALTALLVAFEIWFHTRPRQRAKRRLRRLAQQLRYAPGEAKAVCLRLRSALRHGFGEPRLQAVCLSASDQPRWQAYLARLDSTCFSSGHPSPDEVRRLIDDGRRWLDSKAAT